MPHTRYIVVQHKDEWLIKFGDEEYGPYHSRAEAMLFAIDAAQKLGEQGENTQVGSMGEHGRFRPEWSYGKDPLSAAGIIGSFGLRRSIGGEDEQDRDWAWLAAPRLTMPKQTTLVPPVHIQAVEPATKKKTMRAIRCDSEVMICAAPSWRPSCSRLSLHSYSSRVGARSVDNGPRGGIPPGPGDRQCWRQPLH